VDDASEYFLDIFDVLEILSKFFLGDQVGGFLIVLEV
jgi:hypothetical protein